MRITREWIEQQISKAEKNIEFLKQKQVERKDEDWSSLIDMAEGELNAYTNVLFHKTISGKTCKLFSKDVSMWKRRIVRFLSRICDWLEGVEIESLVGKDYIEKKNDRGTIKRERNKV